MKAAVYNRYGPPEVLELKDLPAPSPKPGEMLVRVQAGTVCAPDWRFRRADPFLIRLMLGLTRPSKDKILGLDFAGVVADVGAGVTRFKSGDAIFGTAGLRMGAHAEFVCVKDGDFVQPRPATVPAEIAATLNYAGTSALHFLRRAKVTADQEILIYGASGGVGSMMVQLAKHFGAHVTGVASARNQDFVRALGAHAVMDYEREDFARGAARFDVVADTVGMARFSQCVAAVKRGGAIVQVSPTVGAMLAGHWTHVTGRARVYAGVASAQKGDIAFLGSLAAQGVLTPPIEARFPLDAIAAAHRLSESGRKRGHVVVLP